jgi:hypothetical protein
MKLRVKDLITPPAYILPSLSAVAHEAPVERFFCDAQLRATLRRVLDHLMPGSISKAPATLLAGEARSGKSRLLRVTRGLLRDPGGPAARKIFPDAPAPTAPAPVWLVADLTDCVMKGAEPESLLRQLVMESAQAYGLSLPEMAVGGIVPLLRSLPDGVAAAVIIDDLDTALGRKDDAAQRLLDFILELAQPCENSTLSLLLAVSLEAVEDEGEGDELQARFRQLLRVSEIVLTDCASLVNLALERLLSKSARQEREIAWLLRALKRRLPLLACHELEFIRSYPLHPLALRLAQQLWSALPEFNLSQFILDGARAVYERPAISVFTVDDLFDRLEGILRRDARWQSLFDAHDQVMRRAVERFNPEWRLWARMLTRALLLYTAAEVPVTSRELAESCLIYDMSDDHRAENGQRTLDQDATISQPAVSSSETYHSLALLLDQMQRLAPEYIESDNGVEPRYRLAQHHYRSIGEKLLAESKAISDAAPQLFRLLCRCGGAYFEDWPVVSMTEKSPSDEWRVEEAPGLMRLIGNSSARPLRVLIWSWTMRGRAPQVRGSDFVWRAAEPSPSELRALKSFAVLSEWQQSRHPNVASPQFTQLFADACAQAKQIFARLLLLDGHLSQQARPVFLDCEPPLDLRALLLRQSEVSSASAGR